MHILLEPTMGDRRSPYRSSSSWAGDGMVVSLIFPFFERVVCLHVVMKC